MAASRKTHRRESPWRAAQDKVQHSRAEQAGGVGEDPGDSRGGEGKEEEHVTLKGKSRTRARDRRTLSRVSGLLPQLHAFTVIRIAPCECPTTTTRTHQIFLLHRTISQSNLHRTVPSPSRSSQSSAVKVTHTSSPQAQDLERLVHPDVLTGGEGSLIRWKVPPIHQQQLHYVHAQHAL